MRKFFILVVLAICNNLGAQTLTVRDNSSREPLSHVLITDNNKKTITSNQFGKADLSTLDKSGEITVYHPSYNIMVLKIGENNSNIDVDLISKLVLLDEVVLSANRFEENKIDVPYQMEIIKQKHIEFGNQPTTGDVMQNTGAVFLQKSQLGGGSAVLRGFEANKVLMVVDGVRMNNAIYRGGHLQDIMTIDPNMLERAEVIFGPSSTIYGSDALGGVMHFYTKNAEFSNDDKMLVNANGLMRYSSVNNELSEHLDFSLGWKKISSLTSISNSQFGDLMSGKTALAGGTKAWDRVYYVERLNDRDSLIANSNKFRQRGSGYRQMDLMQKFNFKTGEHLIHHVNFQFSDAPFLPRYDRLAGDYSKNGKPRFAENGYVQKRMLASYTLNYNRKTLITDHLKLIVAYQKIDQDRITRRFQNNNRRIQMEDVSVWSANLDASIAVKEKHEIRYGAEATLNDVISTAKFIDIKKDSSYRAFGETRYADGGNTMGSIAAYFSHSWEVNDNFVISDGLRFTANTLKSTFTDTTIFKFPFQTASQNNRAITGSLGFTWKESDNYKVSFLMNTGFRTPNVDDMSKVFDSGGGILIVPNENIKPEYAANFELGLSKIFEKKYKFDFTGFYTALENALVLDDYKFLGQDSVLYAGVKNRTQAMQNADRAYVYGFSTGVQFDFDNHLSFKSIVNYTYGRYISSKNDTVLPLGHVPPVFGQTSLFYNAKNINAEFFVRYNGKKASADYSPSGEDNAAYSANPVAGFMPAWFTLNLRMGYNITRRIRLNAACENITDNRYRVFASGINAPGRNFIFSLRYKM
jgi:hemoglobin/transferrin/lactoferrin receptor protein